MAGADITADSLRCNLDYDPITGLFRWRKDRGTAIAGNIAGCLHHSGYWQIRFQMNSVFAHRLAWLHYYGSFPIGQIDHINGIRTDNRIANLRDVTASINLQNYRRATSRKKSCSYLGVYKQGGRYRARIAVNGKNLHVGCFSNAEDAYAAYLKAKRSLHEGNTL